MKESPVTENEAEALEHIGRSDPRRSSRNVLDWLNGQRRLRNDSRVIGRHDYYVMLSDCGVQDRKYVKGFSKKSWERKYKISNIEIKEDLLDNVLQVQTPVVKEEQPEVPAEKTECRPRLFIDVLTIIYNCWKISVNQIMLKTNRTYMAITNTLDDIAKEGIVKHEGRRWHIVADKEFIGEYLKILVPCPEKLFSEKPEVRREASHYGLATIKIAEYLLGTGNKTPISASLKSGIPYKTTVGTFRKFQKMEIIGRDLDGRTWHVVNVPRLQEVLGDAIRKAQEREAKRNAIQETAVVKAVEVNTPAETPTVPEAVQQPQEPKTEQPKPTEDMVFSIPSGFEKVIIRGSGRVTVQVTDRTLVLEV